MQYSVIREKKLDQIIQKSKIQQGIYSIFPGRNCIFNSFNR